MTRPVDSASGGPAQDHRAERRHRRRRHTDVRSGNPPDQVAGTMFWSRWTRSWGPRTPAGRQPLVVVAVVGADGVLVVAGHEVDIATLLGVGARSRRGRRAPTACWPRRRPGPATSPRSPPRSGRRGGRTPSRRRRPGRPPRRSGTGARSSARTAPGGRARGAPQFWSPVGSRVEQRHRTTSADVAAARRSSWVGASGTCGGRPAAISRRSTGTTSAPRISICSSTVGSGSPAWSSRNSWRW